MGFEADFRCSAVGNAGLGLSDAIVQPGERVIFELSFASGMDFARCLSKIFEVHNRFNEIEAWGRGCGWGPLCTAPMSSDAGCMSGEPRHSNTDYRG